ncbi:MAG: metallophosphoesterase [Actinomycetota bacterium]|nr:metallophosphoesterase [Actinomycetota bacterium]
MLLVVLSALLPGLARADSRVTLQPAASPAGSAVSLSGDGFARRRQIVISSGAKTLGRIRAGSNRRFRLLVSVPRRASGWLRFVSRSGTRRVVNRFQARSVARAAAASESASSSGARLRWAPSTLHSGATLTLRGDGFPRRGRVALSAFGRSLRFRTGRRGSFLLWISLPGGLRGGHRGMVKAGETRLPFSVEVERLPPPPPPGPGLSPSPGSEGAFPVDPDPVIAVGGDIACDPGSPSYNGGNGTAMGCRQRATSDLLAGATAVITTGDNQYEDATLPKYHQSYDRTWGRFRADTYPVPGNHEYYDPAGRAAGYFDYFGTRAGNRQRGYYSFDLAGWHFVALNSNCSEVGGCGVGSAQERWLRQDLAANSAACTAAFWHHPRFSYGRYGDNATYQPLWQALYDDGAELVLNGHAHNYQRYAPLRPDGTPDGASGMREFIVGTGGHSHHPVGADLVPNREVANGDTYGILKLTLRQRDYAWEFVPEAGKTFSDGGSTPCH